MTTPFDDIIHKFGSQARLGELLGTNQSTVAYWVKIGRIPAEKAVELEERTGGAIPRWVSRPDLWDAPRPFRGESKREAIASRAQESEKEVSIGRSR